MNYLTDLPPDLQSIIGDENVDFAIKAEKAKPTKQSINQILIGFVWILINIIGSFFLLRDVDFKALKTNFSENWIHTISDNGMVLILGFFLLVGLALTISGIISLFRKGGYIVGTPNRLIQYQNDVVQTYDWEQFTGELNTRADKNEITLILRTGKVVRGDKSTRFVPNTVYLSGAPNILNIEQICRKRIKENDPKPPGTF